MAERLANPQPGETKLQTLKHILMPAILLGLTTNIRVLGPLAAVLAWLYFLILGKPRRIWWFIPYGLIAYSVMVITWPFLWANPIGKFIDVVRFMSDNPTQLRVFFYGDIYRADALPGRYLPTLMLIMLTEPTWPLAIVGFVIAVLKTSHDQIRWQSLLPTLAWFAIPFAYVLIRQPPMYDGFRHFLFILPPIFVLAGIALQAAFQKIQRVWLNVVLMLVVLLPAVFADIRLHPYQYTYYNQFVGGTGAAAKMYETDYWQTCYKDAVEELAEQVAGEPVNLYVKREFYIAAYYAPENITVDSQDVPRKLIEPGDYILANSRANPNLQRFSDPGKRVLRVERDGAIFCIIQRQ